SFNQLTYTLKGFILLDPAVMSRGVENTRYLPLLTPPVDLIVELLFFAGLIIFFIRFKKFKIFYIIFISVLLTEFFTEYPPNFSRGLIYVPLTYLIASLSANKIFLYLDSKSKKLALTFFLLLTIFLSSYNIFKYFSWMNQDSLTNARQPAITYYEFPYWQKYQIKRVTSGLNPITNYEWYDVRKLYLPNQIKKE
ncbi:MAG: hypothetical protein ACD_12C00563G0001, partial [uncultured bacterium]